MSQQHFKRLCLPINNGVQRGLLIDQREAMRDVRSLVQDELYITSAWTELSEQQKQEQPFAGDLFRVKMDIKGMELPPFGRVKRLNGNRR